VYAVGVGAGSPSYLRGQAEEVMSARDVIVWYPYTLDTICHLTGGKNV